MGDFLERLLASNTGDWDEDRSVLRPRPVSLFEPDPTAPNPSVPEAPARPAPQTEETGVPALERTTAPQRTTAPRSIHPEAPAPKRADEDPPASAPPVSPSPSPLFSPSVRPERPRSDGPERAPISPTPDPEPAPPLQAAKRVDLSPFEIEMADVPDRQEEEDPPFAVPAPSRPGTQSPASADVLPGATLVAKDIPALPVPEGDRIASTSTPGAAATGRRETGDPIGARRPESAASRGSTSATTGGINRADGETLLRHDDGLLVPVGSPPPVPAEETAGQEENRRRIEESRTAAGAAETVHVRIGTVEVRASGTETTPDASSSRRARVSPAVMSLDEYLKTRARGGDR